MRCEKCTEEFEIHPIVRAFCEENDIPLPLRCPECRLVRRLQERNARKLYYRKCDFSGNKILSMYHENVPFPVYDQKIWWSDDWDAMDYGVDFDFGRSFFEQFEELQNKVPHSSVFIVGGTLQNSDFVNCAGYLKNCYLISEADYNEDCAYSNRIYHCKDVLDCTNCHECERCYECIDCRGCYDLKFSQECENCSSSMYLNNCIGCKDCVGCVNQRQKQFMIFNKQYSKEEYFERIKNFDPSKVQAFADSQFRKATAGEHNQNVTGDHVNHSKNSFNCFDCSDLEDCLYCAKVANNVKNSIDYTAWGFKAELIYQSAGCGDNAYNIKFCSTCTTNIADLEYCFQCTSSSHLFGCVGLRNKKFCIFNKQYSEEDYFELRKRIIEHMKGYGEWGRFFPDSLCAFGYNETIVMDHFPLEKEEAVRQGYNWCDYEMPMADAADALECEVTGRAFRLTSMEKDFYRKMGIDTPKRCPDQRHKDRMKKRPLYRLVDSECIECGKDILRSVGGSGGKVLCRECYREKVY